MPKLDALETLYMFPVVATVASLLRLFRAGFLVRTAGGGATSTVKIDRPNCSVMPGKRAVIVRRTALYGGVYTHHLLCATEHNGRKKPRSGKRHSAVQRCPLVR